MGWLKHCACERTVQKTITQQRTKGTKKTGGNPVFFVPGQLVAPVAPARTVACEQDKGRRPSPRGTMRPRRARDPARGGHCPRRGGCWRKRQTSASRGCWGSECDWRTGSVGHELASSKRSDGRGAMGNAGAYTVSCIGDCGSEGLAFAFYSQKTGPSGASWRK
jgi:hypothetical protein